MFISLRRFKRLIYNKTNRKNNLIYSDVNFSALGKYIVISSKCNLSKEINYIGDGTYINTHVTINNCEKIGKYCSISKNVNIGLGSHPKNWIFTSPLFYSPSRGYVSELSYDYREFDKKIVIGNDVWIGYNAIIMPGIKIGDGAIIAAGAVVTKDVEEYSIVGGVPATLINYRFNKEVRKKLKELNIYNFDLDYLKNKIDYIQDVNLFIEKVEDIN